MKKDYTQQNYVLEEEEVCDLIILLETFSKVTNGMSKKCERLLKILKKTYFGEIFDI